MLVFSKIIGRNVADGMITLRCGIDVTVGNSLSFVALLRARNLYPNGWSFKVYDSGLYKESNDNKERNIYCGVAARTNIKIMDCYALIEKDQDDIVKKIMVSEKEIIEYLLDWEEVKFKWGLSR